jgi:serine/threonine-protein kinase
MAVAPGSVAPKQPDKIGKGFSELAVKHGYCKPQHIVEAAREQNRLAAKGEKKELKEILLAKGLLTREQVEELEMAQRGARVIAGFEMLDVVGRGAMGTVYRARQIALDRIVAVKILYPKLLRDEAFKARFLREARYCARLNHLHVINGIDCGEDKGYAFFAMEFVDGVTVGKLLEEKGRLPLPRGFQIVRQMAEALRYAKTHELVHRDIKPDNIMLTKDGMAKLCDLGLATLERSAKDSGGSGGEEGGRQRNAKTTTAGKAVGTPHYISPEQARGAKDVDNRSDIYSLGATFYHLITGETPFSGDARPVMEQHVRGETRSPCELNSEIPETWGQIISKMMAKEPADRYADPDALIADLEAVARGQPPKAAEFRAKSSCALPPRNMRRPPVKLVEVSPPPARKESQKALTPPTPLAPARTARARRSYRGESAPSGVLVLVGLLLAGVIVYLLAAGERPETSPTPLPVHEKPVAPAPKPDTGKLAAPRPPAVKTVEPKGARPIEPVRPEPAEPKPAATAPDSAAAKVSEMTPAAAHAYGIFLSRMISHTATADLTQAEGTVRELARQPSFSAVDKAIEAELKDYQAAASFEAAALQALAAAKEKALVRLSPSGTRKCGGEAKALIESYTPARGVGVTAGKTVIALSPADLDPADLAERGWAAGREAGAVNYLILRGMFADARAKLSRVPEAERGRLEEKLGLLRSHEAEAAAAKSYQALEELAAAKKWEELAAARKAFELAYGPTLTAKDHAAQLAEWSAAEKDAEPPLFAGNFHVPAARRADGAVEVVWTAKDAQAFQQDWQLDDPRATPRANFLQVLPQPGTLAVLRGRSGEFWDGQRKDALLVTLRNPPKLSHFRLEVQYTLGRESLGGYVCGVGLWDGAKLGLGFGAREVRGRLGLAGTVPGKGENVDQAKLPGAVTPDRGQLAVQAEGASWTFYSRKFEETGETGWQEAFKLEGGGDVRPVLMPINWGAFGRVEFHVHVLRLVVLPSDPLLRGNGKPEKPPEKGAEKEPGKQPENVGGIEKAEKADGGEPPPPP